MTNLLRALEFLGLSLWLGSDVFLSFVVAPGAFRILASRDQAGAMVGSDADAGALPLKWMTPDVSMKKCLRAAFGLQGSAFSVNESTLPFGAAGPGVYVKL